ncbi:hypothetical protein LRR18_17520, partial [Mangrovimonas sp. AS39]|uniref:hypothetical protein n=1 Tax=Mangrovimonas futianensis TaxID=2895523 RepID=UPI001E4E2827
TRRSLKGNTEQFLLTGTVNAISAKKLIRSILENIEKNIKSKLYILLQDAMVQSHLLPLNEKLSNQ